MAVFLLDTFTTAVDQLLPSHVADTGGSGWTYGAFDIDTATVSEAGDILKGDSFSSTFAYHTATPASAEYDVEMVLTWIDINNGTQGGILFRYTDHATNPTYYCAHIIGTTVVLNKRLSGGSEIELGAYTHSIGSNTSTTLKVECRDATKKVYINGVERISSTNNELTAAGKVGVRISDESRVTSISASTSSASITLPMVERGRSILRGLNRGFF